MSDKVKQKIRRRFSRRLKRHRPISNSLMLRMGSMGILPAGMRSLGYKYDARFAGYLSKGSSI